MPAIPTEDNKRRRRWTRGDLTPVTRPEISSRQWLEGDAQTALEQLRAWAEARTVETITWYLRDKKSKRLASRLLRVGAVVFAVIGGILPLISGSLHGVNPNLGYVSLAIAAGCVAFDHFFGLSSGWMRDIATIQALQGKLAKFHLDWTRWQAAQMGNFGTNRTDTQADTTNAALGLIEALSTDVAKHTEAETAQWIAEFSSSVAALRQQANPSVTSPQDLITWSSHGGLSSN